MGAFKVRLPTRARLEKNPFGKAFVTLGDVGAAAVPATGGDAARARLQERLARNRQRGGAQRAAAGAAEFLIPRSKGEAGLDLALLAVPGGGLTARTVGKASVRGVARGGVRVAGREAAQTAATRTVGHEVAQTAATRTVRREAAQQAARTSTRAKQGFIKRTFFSTPKRAALTATGATLAGGSLAHQVLKPRAGRGPEPGRDDGGGGNGGGGDGGGGGGNGGGGDGGGGGPDFVTDPFLGNITAGIGSLFDRLGGGIADALTAVGVPVGEGAGKAIAVGGTILLGAAGVAKLMKARRPKSKPSTTSRTRSSKKKSKSKKKGAAA